MICIWAEWLLEQEKMKGGTWFRPSWIDWIIVVCCIAATLAFLCSYFALLKVATLMMSVCNFFRSGFCFGYRSQVARVNKHQIRQIQILFTLLTTSIFVCFSHNAVVWLLKMTRVIWIACYNHQPILRWGFSKIIPFKLLLRSISFISLYCKS